MLQIETEGTWRAMGQQVGETFRHWFEASLDRFAPWLVEELDRYRPAIAEIRGILEVYCPELNEETEGMAEAVGFEPDLMLGLRYFNELRERMPEPGCSGLFIADSDAGPVLARTCDIEPGFSQDVQLLRVNRPDDGPATVLVTYVVLTGGVGFNEHGLAMTGSSATPKKRARKDGLPIAVLNHLLMTRCRDVEEAARLLAQHRVSGKGAVELVCDASGASMMVEFVPGQAATETRRRPDGDWQACSNFCFSKGLVNRAGPDYLANAYARYGRIVHQVGEGFMDRTVEGVKLLLTDIAQPGMVCHEPHCTFRTAYAFVVEVRNRKMHLAMGHPAENRFFEIGL